MENYTRDNNQSIEDLTPEELNSYWLMAKNMEKKP